LPPGAVARLGTVRLNHGGSVAALLFSLDERFVVSAGSGGLRIWRTDSGQETAFVPFRWGVESLALSPDGKVLAAGTDGAVELLEFPSGKRLRTLVGPGGQIKAIAFFRGGKELAAVSRFLEACLWDVQSGKALLSNKLKWNAPLSRITISESPPAVYFLEWNNALVKWRFLERGAAEAVKVFPKRPYTYLLRKDVAIFSSGEGLEFVSPPAPQGKVFAFYGDILTENKGLCACANQDGRNAGEQGLIAVYQVAPPREVKRIRHDLGGIYALALSPTNKYLASASWTGVICLWGLRDEKETVCYPGYSWAVGPLAFVDNRRILSRKGRALVLTDFVKQRDTEVVEFKDRGSWSLSPDGKALVSLGGRERTLTHFDIPKQKAKQVNYPLPYHPRVVFSPDGRSFAVLENHISFWDFFADGPRLTTNILDRNRELTAGQFSRDGKQLLVGYGSGAYQIFDTATGREVARGRIPDPLKGATNRIYSLTFAADGKRFVVSSAGGILLFDVATGQRILKFGDRFNNPSVLALSPCGDVLAGGLRNEAWVTLWEVRSGERLATVAGHLAGISALAFSPDGRHLASGSWDNTLLVWSVKELVTSNK
jgi:WD40 repeat protein